ncbi:MAG: hypothetical protein ACFB50_00950 [Rubrobacteraceae bacterium]
MDRAEYTGAESVVGETSADDYRVYLAFMRGAEEELQETRGYGMLPSERDDYTRSYYADEYRRETRARVRS